MAQYLEMYHSFSLPELPNKWKCDHWIAIQPLGLEKDDITMIKIQD